MPNISIPPFLPPFQEDAWTLSVAGLDAQIVFFFFFFPFFYHPPPILACTKVGEQGRCGTLDGEYHNDIIHMQPGLGNPSDAETKTIEKKKRGGGRWIIEEHQRNRKPSLWIGSTFWECFKEHSIVGRKKKKKQSPLYPLSEKSSALAPRREGAPLKAHLLFTLYLHEIVYRRFMLFCFFVCVFFLHACPPAAPFFWNSDSVCVAARLDGHRCLLLR